MSSSVKYLISTVNNKVFQNTALTTLLSNAIVINQITEEKNAAVCSSNTKYYDFPNEIGISKSRNRALEKVDDCIAYLCDDDISFIESFEEKIVACHNKYQNTDIIIFEFDAASNKPSLFRYSFFMPLKFKLLGVSSVQISFKTKEVIRNKIKFDEEFGVGSTYPIGEESIFLRDCLKGGMKIKFVKVPLVKHPHETTGEAYQTLQQVRAKGAHTANLFPKMYGVVNILLAIKSYTLYSKNFSFFRFIYEMTRGSIEYRSKHRQC